MRQRQRLLGQPWADWWLRGERLLLRVQGRVQLLWVSVQVPALVLVRALLAQVWRLVRLLCLSMRPSGPAVPSWRWAKFQ